MAVIRYHFFPFFMLYMLYFSLCRYIFKLQMYKECYKSEIQRYDNWVKGWSSQVYVRGIYRRMKAKWL